MQNMYPADLQFHGSLRKLPQSVNLRIVICRFAIFMR